MAKSRDSSSLLFSAIDFTMSGSAPIACPDAAFSRAATAAALMVFAKLRKYVSMPRAWAFALAFAWIDRNRSAPSRFAIAVRSCNWRNSSVRRVRTTSTPAFCSNVSRRSATSSTSSASVTPLPSAPGSWPPWPASITTREMPSPS